MSQASDDSEMKPEYDIRGGVRGKYFDRYTEGLKARIQFQESILIAESTATAQLIGQVPNLASSPVPSPSPKIQIGEAAMVAFSG